MKPPKGTRNEARWNAVLEAAAEIFVNKGYREARMEDVADRVGILKGSLYYYVHSKEDLLYELILRANRSGMEVLASLDEQGGDASKILGMFIERWVDHVERHHHVGIIFQHEVEQLSRERLDEVRKQRWTMEERVQKLIATGIADGSFSPDIDVELATKSLFLVLNASHAWMRRGGRSPDAAAEQICRMFMDGLRTRGE